MERQMNFFEEGGLLDDGQGIEPVTGNEIPPGSMSEEVRDDIPAQLSEGEYVIPADVVRYFGVKFFEDLRSTAKSGMMDMESEGRIGGEPVTEEGIPMNKEEDLSPEELAMLQEIMQEQPQGMAEGGLSSSPSFDPYQYQMGFSGEAFGTQVGGYENRPYINSLGQRQFILFIDGNPVTPIPEGFVPDTAESRKNFEQQKEEAAKPKLSVTEQATGGGDGPDISASEAEGVSPSGVDSNSAPSYGIGTAASMGLGSLAGGALTGLTGAIGGANVGKQAADFNAARNGLVDAIMSNDADAISEAENAVTEAYGKLGGLAHASVFGEGKTAKDAIANVHSAVGAYKDSLSSMTSAPSAPSVSGATGGEGGFSMGPSVGTGLSGTAGLGGAGVSFGGGTSDTGSGVGVAGSGTAGGGFAEAGLGGAGVSFGGGSSGSSSGGSAGSSSASAAAGDRGHDGFGGAMMKDGGLVKKKIKKRPANKRKKPIKRKGLGGRK